MKTYIREDDGLFVREAPVDKHRPPHPDEPDFIVDADGAMFFWYPKTSAIVHQGKFATPEMAKRAFMP